MGKTRKQTKPDYIYKCTRCSVTAHEPEPSNVACPVCEIRMTLISWPKPDPTTYSKETARADNQLPKCMAPINGEHC